MSFSFKRVASAVALATLVVPTMSVAQDTLLEEIVVTAAKRATTLQEIPIAVSVTSAETIERAQILDINDLQSVVPSLRVSQLQNSANTNFVIRGFGNGANNPGIEPSVGVFIDGVYRSRSAGAISDLPKLERVEVLRGPQSTLFGKNASAGVINVVTRKPSGEPLGQISATAGNFGQLVVKGYYEGGISDAAAFSVAAAHNSRDGYNTNITTGNDVNNRDRQSFRGQLLLNPNDSTEIRIIADYDTIDEECCTALNIVAGPTVPAINFAGGQLVPNDRESLTAFGNVDPTNEVDNSGVSIQIDKEFNSFTLTSLTAFRNVDSFYEIDADFTSAALITNEINTEIDTFTQEFRLTSNSGDKLDWMVGGFYFDESVDHRDDLPYGVGNRPFLDALTAGLGVPGILGTVEALNGLAPGTIGAAGQGDEVIGTLENDAFSVFTQLDFHINDSLTATVGLNYTNDEKEASLRQGNRSDVFAAIENTLIGTQFAFLQIAGQPLTPASAAANPQALAIAQAVANNPATNPAAGLAPIQFLPPNLDFPNVVEDGRSDDDELTYTLRLSYDVSDSLSIYGGVSTGFKASSWNLSRDTGPLAGDIPALTAAGLRTANLIPGTRFASPEEATVYELGLKAKFERGAINLAIFDQSIEGFQSNAFIGTGFNLANAGEQSTQGIEFDLTYFPVDSLKLTLAGTLLDPIYDDFQGAGRDPLTGAVVDLSGEVPGGITETNISASATYNFNIGSNNAFLRADYYFEDETPIGDLATSVFPRETKNLNLSAGIATENGLSFSAWVRNATDHVSLISAFPSVAQGGSFSGYRTPPRTYGVTLTKDF